MKIKLTYDAVLGHALADGLIDEFVSLLAKGGGEFIFSNSLFLDVFRLYVKRGKIKPEDVEVLYFDRVNKQSYSISINKNGRCSCWPTGFCSKLDETLGELVDWHLTKPDKTALI